MRQRGYGRRDVAEKAIVQALRAVGARVERLTGPDVPDLLVGYRGMWLVIEVKTGRLGGLTKRQAKAMVNGKQPYPVARTVDEALQLLERYTETRLA